MSVTGNEFRNAMSRFASGVTVIVSKDAEERLHGITVSAFSSVSLSPLKYMHERPPEAMSLASAEHFTVTCLAANSRPVTEVCFVESMDKSNDLDMTTGEPDCRS